PARWSSPSGIGEHLSRVHRDLADAIERIVLAHRVRSSEYVEGSPTSYADPHDALAREHTRGDRRPRQTRGGNAMYIGGGIVTVLLIIILLVLIF
ncbi:MAG: hypothetical protein M3P94_05315, partial [Chloroflexota bacterium]|nr:hypothetical protein [Chloroflexota bacterium]